MQGPGYFFGHLLQCYVNVIFGLEKHKNMNSTSAFQKISVTASLALILSLTSFTSLAQDGKVAADFSGTVESFFDNGELSSQITYAEGQREGAITLYHVNGLVMESGNYLKGKKNGTWEQFSEAGLKLAIAHYENGAKSGNWRIWDDRGVLRYDMTYRADQKAEIWYMYDEDSQLVSTKSY